MLSPVWIRTRSLTSDRQSRLRIEIDRVDYRAGVKLGVFVEQNRALTVARPIVLLSNTAGLDDPDRSVEAIEIGENLSEAFRPVGELWRGEIIEPAPEIG